MATNAQAPKVLAYLRVTNEAMKRFQDHLEKDAAEADVVKSRAAEAVKACVDHERIFPNQQSTVMDKLASSHAACLEFITNLAAHRTANEAGMIGKPVGQEKKASVSATTGAPTADFDATESGRAFRDRLLNGR